MLLNIWFKWSPTICFRMLQNHPSHATVELPIQKFMSQNPSNTIALEYHEPPNLPLLRLFSVYHNRNQSSRYPHGLRPSRKPNIIQSLLGKVRSRVMVPSHSNPLTTATCALRSKILFRMNIDVLPKAHGGEDESSSCTDDEILRTSKHPWLKGFCLATPWTVNLWCIGKEQEQ